jgi:O-antigen/teichoic acid export membrane protein
MGRLWTNLIDFILVLGGKVFTLSVVFVGGVLVARIAGPQEYGVFSVAMSAVLLCDGMIGSPLDMAAVRFSALHADEPTRTQRFEAMAMHLKALVAAAGLLGLVIGKGSAGRFIPQLDDRGFPLFACFFAATALLLARSVATGLQIRHRFKQYSALDLAQGATRIFAFLLLAVLHVGRAAAYVFAYGLVAAGTVSWGLFRLGQTHLLGRWPSKPDVARMLRYCGYSAGIVALGTVTGRGDLLLLATFRGAEQTSAYGLASQVAMLLAQVAMYASVLTQPRVIEFARSRTLRRLMLPNFLVAAFVGLIVFAAFRAGIVQWGIALIFGRGFEQSSPLLEILLIGTVLDLAIVPVLMVFCIQACPRQAFWGELVTATGFLGVGLAAATARLPWPPEQAMAWVAVLVRVTKLIVYGGLFLKYSSSEAMADA